MKITMGEDFRRNHGVRGSQVRISVSFSGRNSALRIAFSHAAASALSLSLGSYVQAGADETGQFCLRASERHAFGARKVGGIEQALHVKFAAEVFGLMKASRYSDYLFRVVEHKGKPLLVVPDFRVSIVEPVGEF